MEGGSSGLDDFKETFLEQHGLYTRDEELRKTVEVGDRSWGIAFSIDPVS